MNIQPVEIPDIRTVGDNQMISTKLSGRDSGLQVAVCHMAGSRIKNILSSRTFSSVAGTEAIRIGHKRPYGGLNDALNVDR